MACNLISFVIFLSLDRYVTLESGELLVYNVTAEDLNVTFQCLTQLANEVYASPLTRYNYINDIYQTF